MKKMINWFLVIGIVLIPAVASAGPVKIWNGNIPGWTNVFANGTPIDNGSTDNATQPQIATDSQGNVYSTFTQLDAIGDTHIYLSRYDGVDVRLWDADTSSWTLVMADADPIESGNEGDNVYPQIAVDSQDTVYVTYISSNLRLLGSPDDHVYISRYNGTDIQIWDADTTSWTTTFVDGDPIDAATGHHAFTPKLAIDSQDRVYVTFYQQDAGGALKGVYLSRYDGADVTIWDHDTTSWTNVFPDGDPIDVGVDVANAILSASIPQLAIDTQDNVYVAFVQLTGIPATSHLYLTRYNGVDVSIWDDDTASWSTTLADGDPIDVDAGGGANNPRLATDSLDRVYLAYTQVDNNGDGHVYFNHYDGAAITVWDNGIPGWTNIFVDGDPIDIGSAGVAAFPQLAVDPRDNVYITYEKDDVGGISHIYLNRFKPGTTATTARLGIWDNGQSRWRANFALGDPIDQGATPAATPQLTIDKRGRVYVTYSQLVNGDDHIFLSGYNRRDVKIWDRNAPMWTDNFALGDPIDDPNGVESLVPQLTTHTDAATNRTLLYINFQQLDMPAGEIHIFLDRKVQ